MKRLRTDALRLGSLLSRTPNSSRVSWYPREIISSHAVAIGSAAHRHVSYSQHRYLSIKSQLAEPQPSTSGAKVEQIEDCKASGNLAIPEGNQKHNDEDTNVLGFPLRSGQVPSLKLHELPLICPGCGAYSQISTESEPGYYGADRKDLQLWLAKQNNLSSAEDEEMDIVARSLAAMDTSLKDSLGLSSPEPTRNQTTASTTPICGRCHALIHQNDLRQQSIIHPSIDAIRAFLEESPHRRNHVYHVIDAADFPMSMIPQISTFFDLSMRSKNRRARTNKWIGGQQNQMSFVITRADLIARNQDELHRLMPYLQLVLREALGEDGKNLRLGNLWGVSARQGWSTKALKEEVYRRGGGGWLVGKVNVGKSALYETIFPKGYKAESEAEHDTQTNGADVGFDKSHPLLPPLPTETKYPAMPTVSRLPGTTALPVRNAFGDGKGELIDLPGLPRDGIYEAVNPDTAPYLYHAQRINAEQHTVQSGESFVISNLIQIKSVDPELTFLAAPFVPLQSAVRDSEIAASILKQTRLASTERVRARNTAAPETASTISSAGIFKLSHDVTKLRAGPLTRRDAVGLKPAALPFVIFGADILIEGMGWVELSCQVRRRYIEERNDPEWVPSVEIFSPHGKYIGIRRPMNAYLRIGHAPKPKSQRSQRPRRSMKGVKKEMKRKAREARAA